jgi:5-methylcytosine-specific restriction enzyme A
MPRDSRPSAAQRGYGVRWREYRLKFLMQNPVCVYCRDRKGIATKATVVDHIQPHKGDHRLFWKPDNHQALCAPCHNGPKKSAEMGDPNRGVDRSGVPVDPTHHWFAS